MTSRSASWGNHDRPSVAKGMLSDDEIDTTQLKETILSAMHNGQEAVLEFIDGLSDNKCFHMPLDIFGNTFSHYACVLGYDEVVDAIIKIAGAQVFFIPNYVLMTSHKEATIKQNQSIKYRRIFNYLNESAAKYSIPSLHTPWSPRGEPSDMM